MRYDSTQSDPAVVVPENELERRVVRDLMDRLLTGLEERGVDALGARREGQRERWPLRLTDRALEEVGGGWWRARAAASRPGPEGAPADPMDDLRYCDYEVAIGYFAPPSGLFDERTGDWDCPTLLYREREGDRPSTAPYFADLDHPGWR